MNVFFSLPFRSHVYPIYDAADLAVGMRLLKSGIGGSIVNRRFFFPPMLSYGGDLQAFKQRGTINYWPRLAKCVVGARKKRTPARVLGQRCKRRRSAKGNDRWMAGDSSASSSTCSSPMLPASLISPRLFSGKDRLLSARFPLAGHRYRNSDGKREGGSSRVLAVRHSGKLL